MRANIHPAYPTTKVHCACGNTWETRSTAGELHLDICSACHPFFTGKQKLLDTQGRIERFRKKYEGGVAEKKAASDAAAKTAAQQASKQEAETKAAKAEKAPKAPKGEKKPKAEKAKPAGEPAADKQ